MTDKFSDTRWNIFENSGRVADYLSYKGIGVSRPRVREVTENAHNDGGSGDLGSGRRGQ